MPFTPEQYIWIGFILLLSSVLQGAIGFASGLFGIPLLMLVTGIGLPEAVAISLVASMVQNSTAAYRLRKEIDFRRALRPLLIRMVAMPLGVATLYYVGSASRDVASQIVGSVLLAIVVAQQVLRAAPRESLHAGWEWLAFSLGGFLLGFCGMGGPPMVLWVMAHNWTSRRARAFLFYLFTTGMVPQAICLVLFFGTGILWSMLIGAAAVPILLLGTLLGLKLSALASERLLRRLSTCVLVLIGLSAILMPFFRSLS